MNDSDRSHPSALVLTAVALAACAPGDGTIPAWTAQAIHHGVPEFDEEGTLHIEATRGDGRGCSGSVITPTVILTANHCVVGSSPRQWSIFLGQNPVRYDGIRVTDIVTPSEFESDSMDDLALMVVDTPIPAPTYIPIAFLPSDTEGTEVKVVGYGLDEEGRSGQRLSATMVVSEVASVWLELTGDSFPDSGDSGGPVLDRNGEVVAVISRAGDNVGIVTRVDQFRWMMNPVLRREGGCVPGDPEVCDGYDNDCDGSADDWCTAPGGPCQTAEECPPGHCEPVDGQRICTRPCDPASDDPCWDGAYCRETSCGEGICRPGLAGERQLGQTCDDDLQCASLMCRDPGDGRQRCSERCRLDALECGPGFGCAPLGGDCGGCFAFDQSSTWLRGLGEPCDDDEQCRSRLCLSQVCSLDCADNSDCPQAMHCRDQLCVPGPLGELGQLCVTDQDCASDRFCWPGGPFGPVCTETCGTRHTYCPLGASCDFDREVCVPWDVPLGAPCSPEDEPDCAEGECTAPPGEEPRCARSCFGGCPSGFECRLDGPDGALCWPADPPPDESCACSAAGASTSRLSRLIEFLVF